MEQALQHIEQAMIDGVSFPVLSLPYQMVSLLAHTERHMGSVGVGLHQICDWAVAVRAHREEIGDEELAQLDRCGLLLFAKVITRMCEKYLGLSGFSWTQGASEETVDAVMEDVLLLGNSHVHNSRNRISSAMMDRADENGKNSNIVRNFIRYVPNRVRQNYKWAKSVLWIPLFCAYFPMQYFYRILRGRRKYVSISRTIDMVKSREKMLRDLKLYQ